jgi:hypothetical protein
MATELEKALQKAKYTALPLPRTNAGPNTIYAFQDGQFYIVRNPGSCLKLPVTEDPTADLIQFEREYRFTFSGVVGFLTKLFGIGNAKSELQVQKISSASVKMGGLAHLTIETGALIDYLMGLPPTTCLRDLTDPDHLTIVAALRANTFSFDFRSESGTTVMLSLEEASGLFGVDTTVGVEVTSSGHVLVSSPSFVGVVSWDGKKIQKEIDRARKFAGKRSLREYEPPSPMDVALTAAEVRAHQLRSLDLGPSSLKAPSRAADGAASQKPAKRAARSTDTRSAPSAKAGVRASVNAKPVAAAKTRLGAAAKKASRSGSSKTRSGTAAKKTSRSAKARGASARKGARQSARQR